MSRGTHTQLTQVVRHRIRQLRTNRQLTQTELCALAGISSDAVTRIESGSRVPTLDTLEKIAGVFEISVSTLVSAETLPEMANPQSLMRIVYLLRRHPPPVHEACEQLLKAALKAFMGPDLVRATLNERRH